MTLFLLFGCNNGGPVPKEGQAATADGTVIDLAQVSNKITEAAAFLMDSKAIESLVLSFDELLKAVGKKIGVAGTEVDGTNGTNKNNTLLAGAYEIASSLDTKVKSLQVILSLQKNKDLEAKLNAVKTKAGEFKAKLLSQDSTLGAGGGTQDTNAQQALDRSKGSQGTHCSKGT